VTRVCVCYRLPDQEEQVDGIFSGQLEADSYSQDLVLMRNFNPSDICWRNNTARYKQSKRFLRSINDNFLSQVTGGLMRKCALVDFILTSKERVI